MKRFLCLAAAVLFASTSLAYADGFVCQNERKDVNVKVYHYTAPEQGTRRSAVMIVSDPRMSEGEQTIARFTDAQGTLNNSGARYKANVDLRYRDIRDGLDHIGTYALAEVDEVTLGVDFTYGRPKLDGEYVPGTLYLQMRNGEEAIMKMDCNRYLKN